MPNNPVYQNKAWTYKNLIQEISVDTTPDSKTELLKCDTTANPINITLLPIGDYWDSEYKLYVIDLSGTSSTNNITIITPTGHLINGQSNIVINNNYGSTLIRAVDSTNYIAQFGAGVKAMLPVYGAFYDTTTQTASTINTDYRMLLNTVQTGETNGVIINNNTGGTPSRITVSKKGTYNLQFSAQLYRSSGGTRKKIVIWLRKNDIDVPYSSTIVTLQANNDYLVTAWNFYISLNTNDYVELMWATEDTDIKIVSEAAVSPSPEVPSLIVTIEKID